MYFKSKHSRNYTEALHIMVSSFNKVAEEKVYIACDKFKPMFIPLPLRRHAQDQQELETIVTEKLTNFILSLMREYFKLTESRIEQEVCGLLGFTHLLLRRLKL